VHWGCDYATARNIEVDPQRRRFGRRESDFALQTLIECRASKPERVRVVALRWHSSGSEVRLGSRWACRWDLAQNVLSHRVERVLVESVLFTLNRRRPASGSLYSIRR
jgi:hypothetical protein